MPRAIGADAALNQVEHAGNSAVAAKSKIAVTVKGSSCVACIKSLQKALSGLDGVKSVDVEADALTVVGGEAQPKPRPRKSKGETVYFILFDGSTISTSDIETFIKGRDFRITSVKVIDRS